MINVNILAEKWGRFKPMRNGVYNCPMKFVSSQAKLNALFTSLPNKKNKHLFIERFGIEIPSDLESFYEQYNGCRLFFGSLSVFGIRDGSPKSLQTFDLLDENIRLAYMSGYTSINDQPYVFFASLGGDFVFGYKRNEVGRVYGFAAGENEVLQSFDSFTDFWNHYFDFLFDEYDCDGHKIHPDVNYQGIPAIENITTQIV